MEAYIVFISDIIIWTEKIAVHFDHPTKITE